MPRYKNASGNIRISVSGEFRDAVYSYLGETDLNEEDLAVKMIQLAAKEGKNYQYNRANVVTLLNDSGRTTSDIENLRYLARVIDRGDITAILEKDYKNKERSLARHKVARALGDKGVRASDDRVPTPVRKRSKYGAYRRISDL